MRFTQRNHYFLFSCIFSSYKCFFNFHATGVCGCMKTESLDGCTGKAKLLCIGVFSALLNYQLGKSYHVLSSWKNCIGGGVGSSTDKLRSWNSTMNRFIMVLNHGTAFWHHHVANCWFRNFNVADCRNKHQQKM